MKPVPYGALGPVLTWKLAPCSTLGPVEKRVLVELATKGTATRYDLAKSCREGNSSIRKSLRSLWKKGYAAPIGRYYYNNRLAAQFWRPTSAGISTVLLMKPKQLSPPEEQKLFPPMTEIEIVRFLVNREDPKQEPKLRELLGVVKANTKHPLPLTLSGVADWTEILNLEKRRSIEKRYARSAEFRLAQEQLLGQPVAADYATWQRLGPPDATLYLKVN